LVSIRFVWTGRFPEAHRLGVGKAFVHRVGVLDAELTQAQAAG
jgi:hypothetical protein